MVCIRILRVAQDPLPWRANGVEDYLFLSLRLMVIFKVKTENSKHKSLFELHLEYTLAIVY